MAFENTMASPRTGNYIVAEGVHETKLSALKHLSDAGRIRQVTCEVGFGFYGRDGVLRTYLFEEVSGPEEKALVSFPRVTVAL